MCHSHNVLNARYVSDHMKSLQVEVISTFRQLKEETELNVYPIEGREELMIRENVFSEVLKMN